MSSLSNIKEVKKLTGKIAEPNCFVSRALNQIPIFFVSHMFRGAEARYPYAAKVFIVIMTMTKFRPYF